MRTVENWLNDLNDLTLKLIIFDNLIPIWRSKEVSNMSEALSYGFVWSGTRQGFDFWDRICKRMFRLEIEKQAYLISNITYNEFSRWDKSIKIR